MFAGSDLQAVQLLPGGSFVTVSSNAGNWTQRNSSVSGGRSSRGSRGGSASKGSSIAAHSLTAVGCDVAYIDATTGNLMTSSGSQAVARPATQQPSGRAGQQAPGTQPQGQTVMQVHGFQQNGHQPQAQQVLQLHTAPTGSQVYKLTSGTRVVKAGQPYPNTTIVQTAVAVPTHPQQPQQQVGVITIRPQSMPPPQQQQAQQQQAQQQKPQQQQHLAQHVQGVQVALGTSAQLATVANNQQQPQQQPVQPAKVMFLQQAPPNQPHVLVAQPQQQLVVQQQQAQQQPQQMQGKIQQHRQASTPAAFQAVTLRPAGIAGAGSGTIRPLGNGHITLQTVYAPPPAVTTVVRPAVRIPKLGTVATYNPVTGVRSATTTGASGAPAVPLLPANLPATLVQQVQKANLLQQQQQQQQQQQPQSSVGAASGSTGGLKGLLTVQSQLQGQVVQTGGPLNTMMTSPAGTLVTNGGPQQQHQRQTTLVLTGGPGAGAGLATAAQAAATHMGISVMGNNLQPAQQQMMHSNQQIQMVTSVGAPQMQQVPAPQQPQPQQQQQVVNITLADGTTTTTVMDHATLTMMLSESSRGQAAKLQQQRQQQLQLGQSPGGIVGAGAGLIQVQLQAQPLQQQQQQQQMLLQTAPQLPGSGVFTVQGGGSNGSSGKSRSGSTSNGGMEHQNGGLQTVPLAGSAPSTVNGPAQVLIMSTTQTSGSAGAGTLRGAPPTPGPSQMAQLRTMQVLGPPTGFGSLHQSDVAPGPQQPLLQLQQQQQPGQQQQSPHMQLLQLQQQTSMGRRPTGRGLPEDLNASVAALLEPPSLTFAQLQTLGMQRLQQQQHALQPQQLHPMVEGLSVVDLGGGMDQQHRQQRQHMLGPMSAQRLQPGAAQAAIQAGGGISGSRGGLLQGGGLNPGKLERAGSLMLLQEDMTSANLAPGSLGGDVSTGPAPAFGGTAGSNGSSREDLKAILVSIGQELARHGISVETAVTSGWLGVLTAMDVAVLADAYTDEERRLMMQQKVLPPSAQQSQQQPVVAAPSGMRATTDGPPSLGQALGGELIPSGGSGSSGESRSGSSGERGSTATAGALNLTSSSARTSMSVAPSEDGSSSASGGVSGGTDAGAGVGHAAGAGGGSVGSYELKKFNSFQYSFLGAGMLSALGGDLGSDLEKLPAGGLDAERDVDAVAMAEVFGEKPWPPFGMAVMAEEIGLSAQPHLHSFRHPFPPPHASALLGSRVGGSGGGSNSSAALKVIDSASEYEARMPFQQSQEQTGSCSGRISTSELQPPHLLGASSGSTGPHSFNGCSGGNGPTGGKGFSAAPGMVVSASRSSAPGSSVDLDKEIENRFANLDLGCGFY